MRIALTIVYEGLHHLNHRDFALKMASMFDKWIVIEGYSLPYGSTSWCKRLDLPATSQDGTVEFMNQFCKDHPNVYFYSSGKHYNGKDDQVNLGIDIIRKLTKSCYLWEVDVDEHWKIEDIELAESIADKSKAIGFSFPFNHYIGKDMIAKGDWGSGYLNRLWKWSGQYFKSHEPAMLIGQRYTEAIKEVRFEHFSYVFEKDVKFKSQSYSGHENVYKNFHLLESDIEFPAHISTLFGKDTKIGKTNSFIHKIENHGMLNV